MPIRVGIANLKRRFLGNTEIHRVYNGALLLYRSIFTYIESYRNTAKFYNSTIEAESNAQTLMQDLRNKDLFDDATFVMIPSATRYGKVGVQFPERPVNLLRRSEEFDDASWNKSNSSVSANVNLSPNNTLTADKLIPTTSNTQHTITTGGIILKPQTFYTESIYAKADGYPSLGMGFTFTAFGAWYWCNFNLISGTVSGGNTSGIIENVGEGWFRCSITRSTTVGGSGGIELKVSPNLNETNQGPSFTGDGTSGLLLWGAQLTEGSELLPYQKTVDTDFDLTFTRASTATRVNSQGLIEEVPYNLLQRSDDLTNSYYGKTLCTVQANQGLSPTGTNTAFLISSTSPSNTFYQVIRNFGTPPSGKTHTFSIFIKPGTDTNILTVRVANADSVTADKTDLELNSSDLSFRNLSMINSFSNVTYIISNFPNGWKRVSMTYTVSPAVINITYRVLVSGTSNIGTIFLWGPQLEVGTTPTEYVPTTDRLAHPRIGYSSGRPALLLEPQRTNFILNTQTLSGTWLNSSSHQITSDLFILMSGVKLKNLISDSINNTVNSMCIRTSGLTSIIKSGQNTLSFFVKKTSSHNSITVWGFISGGSYNINFNVDTLTVTYPQTAIKFTNRVAGIIPMGNNIYYCYESFISDAEYNPTLGFSPTTSGSNSMLIDQEISVAGFQMEQGLYPTSYIPTTTATVTRTAESYSRNSVFSNGLIGSQGGTWFLELVDNKALIRSGTGVNSSFFLDTSTSIVNGFSLRNFATSSPGSRFGISKTIGSVATSLYTTTTNNSKIAIKWDGTKADIFENGIKVVSNTSFTPIEMEFLNCNSLDVPKSIVQQALWNKPLTDAQCIALTTL
jgi:hypothetical protein